MPDYDKLQQTAKNLIEKFGTDWIYRYVEKGVYDPATNTTSTNVQTDTTVKAVRMEYKNHQLDGEVVKKGDIKLIVEAIDTLLINLDGKMIIDSEVWQIINIMKTKPATKVVYYELQLRI